MIWLLPIVVFETLVGDGPSTKHRELWSREAVEGLDVEPVLLEARRRDGTASDYWLAARAVDFGSVSYHEIVTHAQDRLFEDLVKFGWRCVERMPSEVCARL